MAETLLIALIALVVGAALGWLLTRRETSGVAAERDQVRAERDAARAERDAQTEQFRRAIADLAGAEERARAAEQLIALYEGLQIQAMVRPGMRLLEGFDRAVTRLRAGWAQEFSATLWEI